MYTSVYEHMHMVGAVFGAGSINVHQSIVFPQNTPSHTLPRLLSSSPSLLMHPLNIRFRIPLAFVSLLCRRIILGDKALEHEDLPSSEDACFPALCLLVGSLFASLCKSFCMPLGKDLGVCDGGVVMVVL